MSGRELYNIDLNINVNGVDEGISKLQKMDKEVEKLEKKGKSLEKMKFGSKSYNNMINPTNKAIKQMNKLYNTSKKISNSNPKIKVRVDDSAMNKLKLMQNTALRTQMLLNNQRKAMFKNHSLEMLQGKGIMFGNNSIKITAKENVTSTVGKVKASIQNLKHMLNVKVNIKANAKRAIQTIQNTRKKAREYASGKYEALLTAKSKLKGTVFDRASGAIGRGMRRVGRAVGIGMSALGAASMGSMIKTFADYEKQMSAVKAVTRANTKEFDVLDKQARHLGATTEWTAAQVAEGMHNLGQAGFKTNEITTAMPGLLNLASAGQLQLAEASSIASGTLRAFGLNANKTGHVADILALAASATNSNVSDMGNSMEYAAPFAKALGVSIEDTASAIGMLSNVNIKGSKAGMTLRNMFTSLSGPSKEASKVMKQLGFSAFDAQGNMKNFPTLIRDLEQATSGLNRQQKAAALNKIFGDIGTTGVLSLLDMGPKKLGELTKQLQYSQGAADKMAKTRLDNLAGDFTILKSAVEGMFVTLGKKLSPYMREFVQWLTAQIPKIQNMLSRGIDFFINNWDLITNSLKNALPIIAVLGSTLLGLKSALTLGNIVKDFGVLNGVIADVTGIAGGLKGVIAAIGVSGGVLALAAAFAYLSVQISNSNSAVMKLQQTLGSLGSGISGIMEFFGGFFKGISAINGLIKGVFKSANKLRKGDFTGAKSEFVKAFMTSQTQLNEVASNLRAEKTAANKTIMNSTKKDMQGVTNVLRTAMKEHSNIVKGNTKETAQNVSNSLRGLSSKEVETLRGTSSTMAQLLRGVNNTSDLDRMQNKIMLNMEALKRSADFNPSNIQKDLSKSLNWINQQVKDSSNSMKQSFSDIFNGFKMNATQLGVKPAIEQMVKDIQSAGPELQAAIASNQSAMQGLFKGVDFSKGINDQINAIMQNIGQMNPEQAIASMRGIFSQLGSNLGPEAMQAGTQAGQQFNQGFTQGMESGGAGVQNSGMLQQATQNIGPQAQQAGVQAGQQFGQGMSQGIQQSQAEMQQAMSQNNQMTQQANQMAQQVKQAYTNMYNGASNSVKQLQTVTTSTFSALSASATSQVNAMCSQIIAAWNAMKAVVSTTVTANFVLNISTVGGGGAIPHADGGILTEPHIGLVAEAGPEAVIPLSPSKRARGIELFKKAGAMLGVRDTDNGDGNTSIADSAANKTFIPPSDKQLPQGGGNNVNVKVDVHTQSEDKEQLKQEILNQVERELDNAFDHIS